MEVLNAREAASAGLICHPAASDELMVKGTFRIEQVRDGEVIWSEEFNNLVTTQGKNSILDKFLGLGAAHSNCLMVLVSAAAIAGDTYASHAFTEFTNFSGNRPAVSFSAAASGSKATSANVSFTVTGAGGTVAGCGIVMSGSTTPGDTAASGVLLSAGAFTGGSRTVAAADVLNVSYSLAV